MSEPNRDRRQTAHPIRVRPRQSPANLLVLAVIGVLAVAAAASAFLGPTHDDATPHGQVLGDLQRVADAQSAYYRDHGTFAGWTHNLGAATHGAVRVTVLRADSSGWEAIAVHDMGLTCARGGSVAAGRITLEPPVCYAQPED